MLRTSDKRLTHETSATYTANGNLINFNTEFGLNHALQLQFPIISAAFFKHILVLTSYQVLIYNVPFYYGASAYRRYPYSVISGLIRDLNLPGRDTIQINHSRLTLFFFFNFFQLHKASNSLPSFHLFPQYLSAIPLATTAKHQMQKLIFLYGKSRKG